MCTPAVQIIRDCRLSDRTVLKLLQKLRPHWKGGIPTYVARELREHKRKLDHLYTHQKLDANTLHQFTDGEGNVLTRWD